MKKIQITFSEPLLKDLRAISETKDISLSEIVRRGMEEYVDKIKKENIDKV